MVAHGVSRGWAWVVDPQPQRGGRSQSLRNLAPLRGWVPFTLQPTAYAVGYPLPVLRTSAPADTSPAGCEHHTTHTPRTAFPSFQFHPLSRPIHG